MPSRTDIELLYKEMYCLLKEAHSIVPSYETLYNILRLEVLTKSFDIRIISDIKKLIAEYTCEESVRLYFAIINIYSLYQEGVCCIKRYGSYLPEDELLLFYAKHKKYSAGYCLCNSVYNQYSPDKYTAAAIIECCVNTNHIEEAHFYAHCITDIENSISYPSKDKWTGAVFSNLNTAEQYRVALITEYLSIPPFADSCYYFDCIT